MISSESDIYHIFLSKSVISSESDIYHIFLSKSDKISDIFLLKFANDTHQQLATTTLVCDGRRGGSKYIALQLIGN